MKQPGFNGKYPAVFLCSWLIYNLPKICQEVPPDAAISIRRDTRSEVFLKSFGRIAMQKLYGWFQVFRYFRNRIKLR